MLLTLRNILSILKEKKKQYTLHKLYAIHAEGRYVITYLVQ